MKLVSDFLIFKSIFTSIENRFSILFSHEEKLGLSDEESIYLQNKNKTYLKGISEITRTLFDNFSDKFLRISGHRYRRLFVMFVVEFFFVRGRGR